MILPAFSQGAHRIFLFSPHAGGLYLMGVSLSFVFVTLKLTYRKLFSRFVQFIFQYQTKH